MLFLNRLESIAGHESKGPDSHSRILNCHCSVVFDFVFFLKEELCHLFGIRVDDFDEGDKKLVEQIKKDCELILLNNR